MKQSRRSIASSAASLAALILGVSALTVAQASGPTKNSTPPQTSSTAVVEKSGKATSPKTSTASPATAAKPASAQPADS
jgi:hypothetical protein